MKKQYSNPIVELMAITTNDVMLIDSLEIFAVDTDVEDNFGEDKTDWN